MSKRLAGAPRTTTGWWGKEKEHQSTVSFPGGVQYTDKEGISNLIDALEEKSRSENDQVLVYFSGHGRAYGKKGNVGYLIPSNADWKRRRYTLINMREFDTLSENLMARHALFVVD
ncbi:MAG: hypothetical protein GY859_18955, partial [Desulfobacterales bacterium]|nr:hypothetical protein [Desulfobacterales bacterium]